MKGCFLTSALLGLAVGLWGHGTEAAPHRPNVIVIVTDDQGAVDAACYGSKDLVTPNMDALAARGVRFTQFYAAAPVRRRVRRQPAARTRTKKATSSEVGNVIQAAADLIGKAAAGGSVAKNSSSNAQIPRKNQDTNFKREFLRRLLELEI